MSQLTNELVKGTIGNRYFSNHQAQHMNDDDISNYLDALNNRPLPELDGLSHTLEGDCVISALLDYAPPRRAS